MNNNGINLHSTMKTAEIESPVLFDGGKMQDIPLDKIRLSDFCQRDNVDEDLDGLAESVEKNGLLQFSKR